MKQLSTVILLLIAVHATAQQKHIVKGRVVNAVNGEGIAYSSITNLTSHVTTIALQDGYFAIAAHKGQLLSISCIGFNFDTVRITKALTTTDTLVISVLPLASKLKEVVLNAKWSAYQLDSMERRKNYFDTRSSHTLTAISGSNSGAGIGINLDRFYGSEKKKRRWIELFDKTEEEAYIDYRFSPALVHKYTAFSGEALQQFMQQNRPDYKWLRQHKHEEDLLYYINDRLKAAKKSK